MTFKKISLRNPLSAILVFVLVACGTTAYEIPGEAEDPRKFKRNVDECMAQSVVSFDQCMSKRGYVARPFKPGDRKTMWLPTRNARTTVSDAMTSCGAKESLSQAVSISVNPIYFFDCMKARGFEPKTVDGDTFTPIVFLNPRNSAVQHKIDFGLCGAGFVDGSAVPIDIYNKPNDPRIRCLLNKGYSGVPVTEETRANWRMSSRSSFVSEETVLACGGTRKLGEVVVLLSRLGATAVCLEEKGYRYEVSDTRKGGFRIING